MFNDNLGLFDTASTRDFSFKVNENSEFISGDKGMFRLFGQALGKSLFDNITLNICLNKTIFKALVDEVRE